MPVGSGSYDDVMKELDKAREKGGYPSTYKTKFSGEKDAFPTGATRDKAAGKGRYDLVSPHMVRRLAGVYERGAVNHGDRNWEKGIPFSRLYSSALRHTFQALAGEKDEDHLAQAIWNLTAIIHFEEEGRSDLDDVGSELGTLDEQEPPTKPDIKWASRDIEHPTIKQEAPADPGLSDR